MDPCNTGHGRLHRCPRRPRRRGTRRMTSRVLGSRPAGLVTGRRRADAGPFERGSLDRRPQQHRLRAPESGGPSRDSRWRRSGRPSGSAASGSSRTRSARTAVGAFVFVYLLGLALVVVPLMLAEFALGNRGRADAATSVERVAAEESVSKRWGLFGLFGAVTSFLILSFYAVVGGWTLTYAFDTATRGLPSNPGGGEQPFRLAVGVAGRGWHCSRRCSCVVALVVVARRAAWHRDQHEGADAFHDGAAGCAGRLLHAER